MACCSVRFYSVLNDFLPFNLKQAPIKHYFQGQPAVKDLIESLGVPHTEVDLILVNGDSVDFGRQVRDQDRISVYPVFMSIDISPVLLVHPAPLDEIKFVLDAHLGKLALYLRMFGFDSLYRNSTSVDVLAGISSDEKRVLLTRDRGLLKRSIVTYGYFVRGADPSLQLLEVLERFDLFESIRPFNRCLLCNDKLKPVAKEEIAQKLPEKVSQSLNEFYTCSVCGRIYWKGTHYENMSAFIGKILKREKDCIC